MKFRSPDGRVYNRLIDAIYEEHCKNKNTICSQCKLYKKNNEHGCGCATLIQKFPQRAAYMMGYEIIEDEKKEIEPDECEQNRGEVENCTDCIHNKVCALWCAKECQNAASFQTEGCDYFEPRQVCVAIGEQEAKSDGGKPRPSLVPPALIRGVDAIREFGTARYGSPDNWRKVEPQRYWDALLRHVLAAWDNWKAIDPESGMPHLWHIACNAAFLMQYMEDENERRV